MRRPARRCIFRLLPVAIACFAAAGCGGEPAPTNLLLVVVDTLRADGLSVYGNPRTTSPSIDAFARDAIVFDDAYAPAPNTVPSHASLFTSTYPATHRVWNQIRVEGGDDVLARLAPAHVTLAETLQAAGYQTVAIADGGFVNAGRGLAQGFDEFQSETLGVRNRFRTAIRWLRARDRAIPFFLFLHTYEVHSPYLPPVGFEDRFAPDYTGPLRKSLADARAWVKAGKERNKFFDVQMKFFYPRMLKRQPDDIAFVRSLYDAEVNWVDRNFERLLGFLARQGLLDSTLIVVTADHGEQFEEHGEFYHYHVYEEGLHIPLIIRDPAGPFGVRREQLVDLVDLMPTILLRLGVAIPPTAAGQPIDLRGGDASAEPRFLVGEVSHDRFERQLSVRDGAWSVIFHGDQLERAEVFDVRSDPGEQKDLANQPAAAGIIARARGVASRHARAAASLRERYHLGAVLPEHSDLSAAERGELRALGYLED